MDKTKMTEKINKRRFYRSNLSNVVWNPDTETALADFSKGYFDTEDSIVAKKLLKLGYPEISPDAEVPPDILLEQETFSIEGDVPIMRGNFSEKFIEQRIEEVQVKKGGPPELHESTEGNDVPSINIPESNLEESKDKKPKKLLKRKTRKKLEK